MLLARVGATRSLVGPQAQAQAFPALEWSRSSILDILIMFLSGQLGHQPSAIVCLLIARPQRAHCPLMKPRAGPAKGRTDNNGATMGLNKSHFSINPLEEVEQARAKTNTQLRVVNCY